MHVIEEDVVLEDDYYVPLSSSLSSAFGHNNTITTDDSFVAVVFGKSVRSRFVCLHLAKGVKMPFNNENYVDDVEDEDEEHVVLRLQFETEGNLVSLRSYCRRFYKLGDCVTVSSRTPPNLLEQPQQPKDDNGIPTNNNKLLDWQSTPCVILHVNSVEHLTEMLQVHKVRHWSLPKCQQWQQEYLPPLRPQHHHHSSRLTIHSESSLSHWNGDGIQKLDQQHDNNGHGRRNVKSKQAQAECVANFLVHMILQHKLKLNKNDNDNDIMDDNLNMTSSPIMQKGVHDDNNDNWFLFQRAVQFLNGGTGVVDAAGGLGHVSVALALLGIRSTVVDPRESVGRLPRRERKAWNRILMMRQQQQQQTSNDVSTESPLLYCQPVEYNSLRAWFGAEPPPNGVDTSFRHDQSQLALPICNAKHSLLRNCTAIVALHPDEATDAIVDAAVAAQIPFVVVPCCVFVRLFPNRKKPNSNEPVSTRHDLLEYLQAKHPSIQRAQLPFEGANTVLWSTF